MGWGVAAVRRWVRKQVVRPRYDSSATHLKVTAADGTRLHAVRIPGPVDTSISIVLVHGITNSSRTPAVHAFAQAISAWAHVIVLDLRGHGTSGGTCTLGELEPLDVEAAVAAARDSAPDCSAIVVGSSLGGLAAVEAAARPNVGIAGVVSVSAPTHRDANAPHSSHLFDLCATVTGRAVLRTVFRTRVRRRLWSLDEVAARLPGETSGFTIVVHDPDERYVGASHAELLFAAEPEPKHLWWRPGGGHGTDLFTPEFAAAIRTEIVRTLGQHERGDA